MNLNRLLKASMTAQSAGSSRVPVEAAAVGKLLQGNDEDGHEKDRRAQHPHEGAGGGLVGERADAEGARLGGIARINDASREDQRCGDDGVYDVRGEQLGQQKPARAAKAARPGLNDRPPEDQAGEEEARVLAVVPVLRAEREFVGRRDVPSHVADVHEQPGDAQVHQPMKKAA